MLKFTGTHYFKEVLSEVGISIQSDEPNYKLLKEQSLIVRDLTVTLKEHENYPNNLTDFIAGLKHLIRKETNFKTALSPCQFEDQNGDDVETILQDNLFRLFLGIDFLQDQIISIILQELTAHAVRDEETMWVRLLLSPLQFLPHINNAKDLTMQLLEILEVATYNSQLEFLSYIPNIILNSEFDEVAKNLSTLLSKNNKLTVAVIDCLNYLNVNSETKAEIEDKILVILNSTPSLKIFQVMFCFLVTDCKPSNLPNILLKTRSALDVILQYQNETEEAASGRAITFNEIHSVISSMENVSECFFNIINRIRSSNDHKPIDLMLLLMLHSHGIKKKQIEIVLKRKVKNGQLNSSLLETMLQEYLAPQTLNKYFQSILALAECLLRFYSDPLCLEVATMFYTLTFAHKYAEKQHRQQIISSLIALTGSIYGKSSIPTLHILLNIAQQNAKLLQPHAVQLMTLLDRSDNMNLKDVQQMFELICNLTCGPDADESLSKYQTGIHMMVKKQLSNSNENIKYKGIIAAVSLVKNMIVISDPSDPEIVDNNISISNLPPDSRREAAILLERINTYISNCVVAQVLYYDQMAQVIVSTTNINSLFLSWLFAVISNNFRKKYIVETINNTISFNDIPVSLQYNLNTEDEIEPPLILNIAELTIQAEENNNVMLVFAPLFRLLRLIDYRQNGGKLLTIDAVLGCGIIMPDLDPDLDIEMFDSLQSKQIIDCLFHCINWFREVISAFVRQKVDKLRERVVKRLEHLVELEEMFLKCMQYSPNHKLPFCYYYNVNLNKTIQMEQNNSAEKPPAKRKKIANTSTTKITGTAQTTNKTGKKTQPKKIDICSFQFRELDTDIIFLLIYPLAIEEPNNKLSLSFKQFIFVLKDLITKLNTVMKTSPSLILTPLAAIKPHNFITDCIRLMPHINKRFVMIVYEMKKLLKQCDNIRDAQDMFSENATDLKISFSLILEMFSLVMGWNGFHNSKNMPLLRECLRALIPTETSQYTSSQSLTTGFINRIMMFTDCCLTLSCAVHLVNVVKTLCNLTSDATLKNKVVLLSGKLLSHKWFNVAGCPETGSAANAHIEALVTAHLMGSDVEGISNIVSWVHEECSNLKTKDDCLQTFPSINKLNFSILLRGLWSILFEAIQGGLDGLTNEEHLELWSKIVTTMRTLKDITKMHESKINLSILLKKSIGIVKIFSSQGLPILEIMIRTQPDKVVEILHTLQRTTRYIQNLCCHSKMMKDTVLMAHVPQIRFTLETLVYRVKAALTANNCSSAFWMGALKNKNLQGEEIMSQNSIAEEEIEEDEQSNEEEPLPEDDEGLVETLEADNSSEFF